MSLKVDQREWDDLARRDAMWAVASSPDRRGAWDVDDFLATGEHEVAGLLAGLGAEGLLPPLRRALDFGCGLGRLTRALARRFDEVIGVDISPRMVGDAQRLHADQPNCRFLVNGDPDLSLLPDATFDLVVSLIALQHVSSRSAIRSYVREFVRVTAPGGVVVFQLPTRVGWRVRLSPLRMLNRLARRLPAVPDRVSAALMPYSMSLVGLPEDEVRRILEAAGAEVVTAFPDRRTGSPAVPSRTYVATVRAPAGDRPPPAPGPPAQRR